MNLLPLLCELHTVTARIDLAQQDLKRAKQLLSMLEPWRGLVAPVYLAEGILATKRNKWSFAERAFAAARETEQTYGFPYNEARVLAEWAKMRTRRNHHGDQEKATDLLRKAFEIYQRCEAKKDIETVRAALASL